MKDRGFEEYHAGEDVIEERILDAIDLVMEKLERSSASGPLGAPAVLTPLESMIVHRVLAEKFGDALVSRLVPQGMPVIACLDMGMPS